jgi:putative endonuclease
MPFAVYILASKRNGTLYVGVTRDLGWRVDQHRAGAGSAFTRRYGVTRLVYAEAFDQAEDAIAREKQLKGWNRAWKLKLIETTNPNWLELSADL